MTTGRRFVVLGGVLAVVVLAVALVYGPWRSHQGTPAVGSEAYEQTVRHFYRGLAALQVGLVDQAKQDFTGSTVTAPGEPAGWANLGLAHLRLGEFDAAAPAIERAVSLAPDHAAVVFLQGRLETSRGRRAEGIALLRRAVALDEANLLARTALIQEIENAGGPDADAEAQQLLETLVSRQPDNIAVLVDRARLAAKRSDPDRLRDTVTRLAPMASAWPAEVVDQFRAVESAVAAGDLAGSARALAFLRNVLARVPAFLEARRRVTPSAELIAEPFITFLRLPVPTATPSPIDDGLAYTREDIGAAPSASWQQLTTMSLDGTSPPITVVADGRNVRRLDARDESWPLAASAAGVTTRSLVPLDWNHDFRMDVVVAGTAGVQLFVQTADSGFTDETTRAWAGTTVPPIDATGAWAADVEMDGDLDVVVGNRGAPPMVLRNNGNGTWQITQPFAGVAGTRAFVWGDLDADGDPDPALLDDNGALYVFANQQAGQFVAAPGPTGLGRSVAMALADANADGVLDLVTLDEGGVIRRSSLGAGESWGQETLATWTDRPWATRDSEVSPDMSPETTALTLGDLDNNGALDVVASHGPRTTIWLAGPDYSLRSLNPSIDAGVARVVDVTGDGYLDLVGLSSGRAVRYVARPARAYHYQVIRPRAQTAAGDQRINSFGVGGEVEVRAGLLTQKQVITDSTVHIGLGTRTAVDVARIIWPNGVPQAEFDPPVDGAIVAEQRLKGSCPWIFADNGTAMAFVTDFLWRSPLGLRINAQDTAGVLQTEDWVKIRGDQLVAREGVYDIRMSAELWETHFVDHVSLMVVDHPADVQIFVDERFAPAHPPKLAVHAVRTPTPVRRAIDQDGADVTSLVSRHDGRHLGTFPRGQYQGVAATDHFVEVELAAPVPAEGQTWLLAHGWVYPTDSSINVAIGQGGHVQPRSLSLEAQSADGRWVIVATDLGFPAGKNKTILLDLSGVARAGAPGATRLRLRTNLEIYWDAIASAAGAPDVTLRTTRLAASKADLRYRGFSQTTRGPREEPEEPRYDRVASTTPRWRNLVGYYTRFGDVRALLERVEDRYMIMNAGDELRLSFPAPPAPAAGWARDFVLIGDGWVKDGDYNTSYAKTVLPLPTHASAVYQAAGAEPVLEQDPVYRRHADDWQSFHTRFETAREFVDGLRLDVGAAR